MNWIISANEKVYNFDQALGHEYYIDWSSNAKFEQGDIVYIYSSAPKSAITHICEVIKVNITKEEEFDDSKYYIGDGKTSESSKNKHRIKLLKKLDNPILLEELKKYGLKSAPQGPICVDNKPELLELLRRFHVNYYTIAAGEGSKDRNFFFNNSIAALGWETGDISNCTSIEEVISLSSAKKFEAGCQMSWMLKHINIGDILYLREGRSKLIAKGIVTKGYYYVEEEYPSRIGVSWEEIDPIILDEMLSMNTLSRLKSSTKEFIDSYGNDETNERDTLINEYKMWLEKQVKKDGEPLDHKTIAVKINSLKDYENYFNIQIFGETDIDILKGYKELLNNTKDYEKYKGQHSTNLNKYIHFLEYKPIKKSDTIKYDMSQFLDEVFMDEADVDTLTSILRNRKNLILKGAPGVGKTFVADRLAYLMMGEKDSSRVTMIQFHQSYSYEDFIEGYRPNINGDGFELNEGPFVKFARRAQEDPTRDYFFIIDEINRGNMSKVFGELMMLIETDKRGKSINLLYSNELFSVPKNLYIIGMMNTADRSLALLDYALRRRFAFYDVTPAFENKTFLSQNKVPNNIIELIKKLNIEIKNELGSGFQIGHSYFTNVEGKRRIKEVIEYEIIPQLQEYWFDDEDKANECASQLRGAMNEV